MDSKLHLLTYLTSCIDLFDSFDRFTNPGQSLAMRLLVTAFSLFNKYKRKGRSSQTDIYTILYLLGCFLELNGYYITNPGDMGVHLMI